MCVHEIDGICWHSGVIPGIPCERRKEDDNCPEDYGEEP
jgi:hypothetical protein